MSSDSKQYFLSPLWEVSKEKWIKKKKRKIKKSKDFGSCTHPGIIWANFYNGRMLYGCLLEVRAAVGHCTCIYLSVCLRLTRSFCASNFAQFRLEKEMCRLNRNHVMVSTNRRYYCWNIEDASDIWCVFLCVVILALDLCMNSVGAVI